MHRNILLTALLVTFMLASALVWAAPDIDDPATDFRFMDLDGNYKYFLEEYPDTVIVLEWFGYW